MIHSLPAYPRSLVALALGFEIAPALYVAIALTYSGTIIVVKLLSDKKGIDFLHGRRSCLGEGCHRRERYAPRSHRSLLAAYLGSSQKLLGFLRRLPQ